MTEGIGLAPQGFFVLRISHILHNGEMGVVAAAILARRSH